jgi:hypothetical protein
MSTLVPPVTEADVLHHLASTHGLGLPPAWMTVADLLHHHRAIFHVGHHHGVHVVENAAAQHNPLIEFHAAQWASALALFLAQSP